MSDEFMWIMRDIFAHVGKCDKHDILYVIIDPTNSNGSNQCPICDGSITKEPPEESA